MRFGAFFLLGVLFCHGAMAQLEEEVIVTGIRASDAELPGVLLKRQGDYLLLNITVTNDSRDKALRQEEIYKTLNNAINLAKKDSAIALSVVKDGFVFPLTAENHTIDLRQGERQDTSEADISIKTKIAKVADPAKLMTKLKRFSTSVSLEGRTEFIAADEVDVSIVNPNQYRQEIVRLIAQDIKLVTSTLGEDYRVLLEGVDRPVEWVRSGPAQLSLYIPYSYSVIPKNIQSYFVAPEY